MNGLEYIISAFIFAAAFQITAEVLGMIADFIKNKIKNKNNANQR